MGDILYTEIYSIEDPQKIWKVCDMNLSTRIADPLTHFEDPEYMSPPEFEGLCAIGGEINPQTLVDSYRLGIFPWSPFRGNLLEWFCPRERYVIFPKEVHVSHSMRNLFNKDPYKVTINQDFEGVIRNCSQINGRNEHEQAWLGEKLITNFLELNKRGYAKSVEVWENDNLVGGFYGFWHNGVFQGDSMFSKVKSASKYALISLCRIGEIDGIPVKLIDCQIKSPLFESLGARYISYPEFRRYLDAP